MLCYVSICSIHLCVTHLHTKPGVADKFLTDVRNSLDEILKNPEKPVEGKVKEKCYFVHIKCTFSRWHFMAWLKVYLIDQL